MQPMLTRWNSLKSKPFGKILFSYLAGKFVPYTGSIDARVNVLEPGYAEITMKERRKLQNHLNSIHAIALANLAEYAGNLALLAGLPDDARFIVKSFEIEYVKKARGVITAKSKPGIIESSEEKAYQVEVNLYDESGDVVTICQLQTLVGPKK
jgi:acyl-coenzyme A thioesterase PaaI-like protein